MTSPARPLVSADSPLCWQQTPLKLIQPEEELVLRLCGNICVTASRIEFNISTIIAEILELYKFLEL